MRQYIVVFITATLGGGLVGGCLTTQNFVTAPPPMCMSAAAKQELRTLCAGQFKPGGACESLGDWLREFVKWRRGVYGRDLCLTEAAAAEPAGTAPEGR